MRAIIQYSRYRLRKTPSGILTIAIGSIGTRRIKLACVPEFSIERPLVNYRICVAWRSFRRNFVRTQLNLLHYSIIAATTFTSALFHLSFSSLVARRSSLVGRFHIARLLPTCHSISAYLNKLLFPSYFINVATAVLVLPR